MTCDVSHTTPRSSVTISLKRAAKLSCITGGKIFFREQKAIVQNENETMIRKHKEINKQGWKRIACSLNAEELKKYVE